MLRSEVAAAMPRREPIGNSAKHSSCLRQADCRRPSVTIPEVELRKDMVQPPFLFGSTCFTSSSEPCSQSISMLPVIATTCEKDLSENDATAELHDQSARPGSLPNNTNYLLDSTCGVITSTDRLQFDLDDR